MPDLSKAACELSIQHLFRKKENCHLWTYTFADDVPPAEAARRWRLFVRWHVETARACVRVLESGGMHGRWHYHCVTPQRWDVNEVRAAAERCGFGRINVKKIPANKARYVAKYLRKHVRTKLPPGQRRWACVGFDGVPVNRVKASSRTWYLPKMWGGTPYTAVEWNFEGMEPMRCQIRKADTPEAEEVKRIDVSLAQLDALKAGLSAGECLTFGEYRGLSVTQKVRWDLKTETRIETAYVEHTYECGGVTKTITEWLPLGADVNAVTLPAEPGTVVKIVVRSIRQHQGQEYVTGVVVPLVGAGESQLLSHPVASNLCNPC
jgi:hypothetical protein